MPAVYQPGRMRSMGGQTQTVTSAYTVTKGTLSVELYGYLL